MRFIASLIFVLLLFSPTIGQTNYVFKPIINDSLFFNAQLQQLEANYQNTITQLKGVNKKEITNIFKDRFTYIKSYFTDKKLYCNNKAHEYLEKILFEIVKVNPELQKDTIFIFFNSTEVPNAASLGEKMLIFNTGLFRRLENESQIAFVLCHELAHLILNHNDKQIIKYVETINSSEFQEELKKITTSEFRKRKQFETLIKGLSFDTKRHSRYKEAEADSMAILFLKNTHFNVSEAIKALAILDTIDVDKFDTEKVLANVFNAPNYPFKKSWIEKEEGLLGGHATIEKDKKIEDSLKTHPDCSERIKNISKLIDTIKKKISNNVIDEQYFLSLQKQLELDNLETYYQHKNYDLTLFYALKAYEKNASNLYTITTIGKTLNSIFDAQKSHTLTKFVNMPAPGNSASFNSLLQFLQNLYADEIANINANFLLNYQSKFSSDNNFNKTMEEAHKRKSLL